MITDDLAKMFGLPFSETNYRVQIGDLDTRGAITQKAILQLILLLIEKQIENEKIKSIEESKLSDFENQLREKIDEGLKEVRLKEASTK